jgi:hypothetical protein
MQALAWLGKAAFWAYAAPLALASLALGITIPAWLAVLLVRGATWTGVTAIETAAIVLLAGITGAGLRWAFAGRRLHSWLRLGRAEPTLKALAVTAVALVTFAALSALLYRHDALALRFQHPPAPVAQLTAEQLVDQSLEFHAWQVVNAIPFLDAPQDLRWEKPYELEDSLGGFLLVVFQCIVIIPLLQVARLILSGHRRPFPEAVVSAVRSVRPKLKLKETRAQHGYEEVVIQNEPGVLIDVIEHVWTEDVALARLARVPALLEIHGCAGYLLVTDAVTPAARVRVEQELREAPFPAELIVWRGDQSSADLRRPVEAFVARLTKAPPADEAPAEAALGLA